MPTALDVSWYVNRLIIRSRWVCRRVVSEDENTSTCKGHKSEAQTLPIGRNPIVGQDYIGEWLVQE